MNEDDKLASSETHFKGSDRGPLDERIMSSRSGGNGNNNENMADNITN